MLDQSQIKLDSTVSFDLYPAHQLQAKVTNAKVLGIFNAAVAQQLGYDAPAMHVSVYPTLPPGTPNKFDQYLYVYVKLANGEKTFYGLPWIKDSTFKEEMIRTVAFYVDNISPDQENLAVRALSALGLTVAKVEVQ